MLLIDHLVSPDNPEEIEAMEGFGVLRHRYLFIRSKYFRVFRGMHSRLESRGHGGLGRIEQRHYHGVMMKGGVISVRELQMQVEATVI